MAHYTDGAQVKVGDTVFYRGEPVTVTAAASTAGNEAAVTPEMRAASK